MKAQKTVFHFPLAFLVVFIIAVSFLLVAVNRISVNSAFAKAYSVQGIDVSHYQGDINWELLSGQGIDFAFIKATEGSGLVDEQFKDNWENAGKTKMYVGAYHFFSFDSDAKTQAQLYIDTVGELSGKLPPAADVEYYGDKRMHPPDTDQVVSQLSEFLNILEQHYGVKPIIYTTYPVYKSYIKGRFEDYPLWIRNVYYPPDVDMKGKWWFWQYSDTAVLDGYSGKEKSIDRNVWRGTSEELEEWLVPYESEEKENCNMDREIDEKKKMGNGVNHVARMDLWQYCTWEQCEEMLLSFRLLGENNWPKDKILSCLYALANHGEKHYTKLRIPKKSGGYRTLLAPDPLLKYVQKNLLHHVLEGLSVSDQAAAYRKKGKNAAAVCGCVENASLHSGKPLILKLDIESFFENITFPMILHSAFPIQYFPSEVGKLLAELCSYLEYLPQGAPTSPTISNLVMKPFDEYMAEWCRTRGIVYSRYCDDLTFSGNFDPGEVIKKAEGFLKAMGFELNRKKTRVLSKASRQTVTGLVVNEKVQPSREYRRKLRQEFYYCRKYGVEEHLRRRREQRICSGGKEDGKKPYLNSLLGKINYVQLTRPEDKWLLEAGKWVKEQLSED